MTEADPIVIRPYGSAASGELRAPEAAAIDQKTAAASQATMYANHAMAFESVGRGFSRAAAAGLKRRYGCERWLHGPTPLSRSRPFTGIRDR
jgi:hypothetical protein